MLGLDYSAGRPSAAEVKRAGYGFVVRYCGTPGRGKSLTPSEAADMAAHGVSIALVYEDRAGAALQGRARGRADARSVLDDAARCGVPVRCAYFAVDFDVTSSTQQAAVDDYLAGATDVLGAACVGVYGEYSVVEHCLSIGAARYGWQTMAWSAGRISARAHLIQRLGQVEVDGVVCDVNEARQADFGQWPAPIQTKRGEDDMAGGLYQVRGESLVCAGGPGYWRGLRSAAERDALAGPGGYGPVRTVTAAQRDALQAAFLRMAAPSVDAAALAEAVVAALPRTAGTLTAADVEQAVRAVFADAGEG